MATQTVEFRYDTGLKRSIFRNPVLRGSWDASDRYAELWLLDTPMEEIVCEDGCQREKPSSCRRRMRSFVDNAGGQPLQKPAVLQFRGPGRRRPEALARLILANRPGIAESLSKPVAS